MAGKLVEEGRNMFLGDSRNEQILVMRVDLLYVPEWKKHKSFCCIGCLHKIEKSSKQWQRSLFEEIYLRIWPRENIKSRLGIWTHPDFPKYIDKKNSGHVQNFQKSLENNNLDASR
jgi:hypothetical protein